MNPIPKFKLTCQHKQAQIKYDANEENKYQVNHYYKFGDKVMLINDQVINKKLLLKYHIIQLKHGSMKHEIMDGY